MNGNVAEIMTNNANSFVSIIILELSEEIIKYSCQTTLPEATTMLYKKKLSHCAYERTRIILQVKWETMETKAS